MFQIYIHGLSNEKHTLDICECEIEFKKVFPSLIIPDQTDFIKQCQKGKIIQLI